MEKMRVLFDLQHPAHLHVFRNLILRLKSEGHSVKVTGRDKDILIELAGNYGIDITVFGVAKKGLLNLGTELLYRGWRLYGIIKKFKPDVMMAVAGTYISLLGKMLNIPTYVFYDTEHATVSNLLAYPFSTCIYVPQCYRKKIKWKHIRYNGYHELAYLHPKYFKPDPSVLKDCGLAEDDIFTVVRFVGWAAVHDVGLKGFSRENKIRAVHELSKYGRVLISCEGELPSELEEYRLDLDVSKMHHVMAFAAMIFGESATMASEGAVMGIPGIYVDPVGRGYTEEQEHAYGIVFNFTPENQIDSIEKAVSILKQYDREHWKAIGRRIIEDKIDVTDMMYEIAVKETSPG